MSEPITKARPVIDAHRLSLHQRGLPNFGLLKRAEPARFLITRNIPPWHLTSERCPLCAAKQTPEKREGEREGERERVDPQHLSCRVLPCQNKSHRGEIVTHLGLGCRARVLSVPVVQNTPRGVSRKTKHACTQTPDSYKNTHTHTRTLSLSLSHTHRLTERARPHTQRRAFRSHGFLLPSQPLTSSSATQALT